MYLSNEQCVAIAQFLRKADSMAELAALLNVILTPTEIDSLTQRLSILDGLSLGTPQREIAESLRVGIATVTRGSREWQEHRDLLAKYFPRERAE